jgi:excisionase family DNA binding protein
MERLLYTKKEAGNVWNISQRSVDYLIENEVIKPIRFGKKVLIRKQDVEKLAQRGFTGRINQKSKVG